METGAKDRSIIEAVVRRREHCARLSELANARGQESSVETPVEAIASDERSSVTHTAEAQELATSAPIGNETIEEPTDSDPQELDQTIEEPIDSLVEAFENENEIDMGLFGEMGSFKNSNAMLDELISKLDFGTIPLTQPKRVLAKSVGREFVVSGEGAASAGGYEKAEPAFRSRKKPTASLLDSYFKGL